MKLMIGSETCKSLFKNCIRCCQIGNLHKNTFSLILCCFALAFPLSFFCRCALCCWFQLNLSLRSGHRCVHVTDASCLPNPRRASHSGREQSPEHKTISTFPQQEQPTRRRNSSVEYSRHISEPSFAEFSFVCPSVYKPFCWGTMSIHLPMRGLIEQGMMMKVSSVRMVGTMSTAFHYASVPGLGGGRGHSPHHTD